MKRTIAFRREARNEFDRAADEYENNRPGLGSKFLRNVHAVLDRIAAMPEVHRVVFKDARRANVKQFPYSVIYKVEPDRVVIIAVIHGNRNPVIWQSRV